MFELGLISERDSRRTLELLQNSLHGERTGPAEFELIKKDGSTITLEVSTFPLRREGNVEILGIARDVSERKKAEKALVESQQKFERLFKSQADPAVFADVKDRFEDVNPRFTELFGYTADEVRGKRLDDLLVPEGRKEEAAMLTEKSKEGYVHCETVRKNKDGVLIPVILSAAPIIVNGRFEGCIISYKDITERKFMEETLRDSEEKFRAISNSARDGIILIDNEAKISYWNPAAERIFGYKAEEAIGKEVHHFLLPENLKQRTTEAMRRFMETRTERLDGRTLETVAIRKDGSEFQAELAVSGFQMKGKWQAVGRVSDITERNQMLKKLEEYSQRLEEMVEKRTEELEKAQERLIRTERLATIGQVAAMVGHDLRNPLTGIKGAAYYLKTKPASRKDKKTMEMLSLIEKDVEYSDKIVTDLLEYSREMHLEPTETTPKSLVEKTLSLISAPQDVIIENLTQDQPRMRVDVEKMDRVFVNLIRNAFDAMPKGGKLTIKSRATGSWAVFTFTDTGVGITQDQMEKIWTPFSTTKAKGMGLGLAICKRIVEAHRGRISISSTRAKGTSITVVVPTEQKARTEGGDETWVKPPESSSSTTMKASEKS